MNSNGIRRFKFIFFCNYNKIFVINMLLNYDFLQTDPIGMSKIIILVLKYQKSSPSFIHLYSLAWLCSVEAKKAEMRITRVKTKYIKESVSTIIVWTISKRGNLFPTRESLTVMMNKISLNIMEAKQNAQAFCALIGT